MPKNGPKFPQINNRGRGRGGGGGGGTIIRHSRVYILRTQTLFIYTPIEQNVFIYTFFEETCFSYKYQYEIINRQYHFLHLHPQYQN